MPTSSSRLALLAVVLVAGAAGRGLLARPGHVRAEQAAPAAPARDYPVQPVPFTAVTLDDEFWAPRIETNRTASIPTALQQCELTGRVGNFRRAAQVLRGEPLADTKAPGYPFDDSDLYKVIEGASYALSVHPDAKLDAYVDQLIATIAAAQEPDGYLYTTRTINPAAPHPWAGKVRWEFERDDSHELYNLGHLFEAAAAHYQSTGKRTLLDVAMRGADLLDRTFGPGKASIWPGHQVTEMGLVRLYRVTGNERYLALAKFLIDERGPTPGAKTNGLGLEYNQAQVRAVEQTEPVGHAVRAMYMYAGMADVAALTGDVAYVQALEKIWTNTVGGKLYLTGGIGSTGAGEAFGKPYELPNMTAYNETCASVGMDYWNHRLFLLHGDGRYIDVLERTLYNALLSGVALDGKTYFYPNPLESAGQHQRSPWFGVACCPGNITRFLASLPGYVYAHQGDAVYVNLYAAGTATIDTGAGHRVRLRQQTRYPWDGVVTLTVTPETTRTFPLRLRIPGWAREAPVPSDLYRFAGPASPPVSLSVNGVPVPIDVEKGYANVSRAWAPGDTVTLDLPMPARRVQAHPSVAADRGRVAVQRGPIVYAAEWPDNDGDVRNVVLPDDAVLASEFRPSLLGGVQVVTAPAVALSRDKEDAIVRAARVGDADPVCDVGQPGPGSDGGVAGGGRRRGAPSPLPDARHAQHGDHLAGTPQSALHQRRRDARVVFRSWLRTSIGGRARARRRGWSTRCRKSRRSIASPSTGSTTPAAAKCASPHRGRCSTRTATPGVPSRVRRRTAPRAIAPTWSRSRRCARPHSASTSTMQSGFSAGIQEWTVQ